MVKVYCARCKKETDHVHLHDAAHGIPETHMAGSERYECTACHSGIYKEDAQGLNLRFILD
ncbi:MAG: hypothetical protein HYT62_00435 [Candidatus Yanofskybacteria bacterium]|nr:hypothetical protein [Candidatus Yanofskybacteria bacterium]